MGACTLPRTAYPTQYLPTLYLLTSSCFYAHHVPIECFITIAMIDDHMIAITSVIKTRVCYNPIGRCIYRSTYCSCKIESCMHLGRLINRIDTITKARCNMIERFVRHRLYGRNGG